LKKCRTLRKINILRSDEFKTALQGRFCHNLFGSILRSVNDIDCLVSELLEIFTDLIELKPDPAPFVELELDLPSATP
jgi:hypothetical protein